MIPPWLHALAILSLLIGGVSALVVIVDEVRRPPKIAIMALVWPLTALFGGLLWLWLYWRHGRGPVPGQSRSGDGQGEANETPMPIAVAKAASHCGAGCTLGDIVAEWLAFWIPGIAGALGWHTLFAEKIFAVWILDFLVAFLLGIGFQYFTIRPMQGGSRIGALGKAIKADTLSISAWQVGMYGAMAIGQFALMRPWTGHVAPVNSPEFWFMMQIAMLAGFATAYPVNWWLVSSGVKEKM